MTYEQYIRQTAVTVEDIDRFLDPDEPTWAQFDPELGYILGNYMPKDGIDGSSTISTVQKNGARTAMMYADRPCRINTYGNSFTQCHQVSDEETWQEYLAAHLGEPIRNFGMGGYGVYQAYRRMVRTEKTEDSAEYVILYIWGDDHHRSLLRCRHILTSRHWNHRRGRMFHGNFWANVEMDLETGRFVERDSMLGTPESLYKMSDPDFMVAAVKDDLMLEMSLFCRGDVEEIEVERLDRLGELLDCGPVPSDDPEERRRSVEALRNAYAFAATMYIAEQAATYVEHNGKKLMIALLCPRVTRQLIGAGARYDQPIVDFLERRKALYFDMNRVHAEDYRCFNLPVEEYLSRYFIGHYSPAGNHFFAYSIKDSIVDWLVPKPITYRDDEAKTIDFRGYLSG